MTEFLRSRKHGQKLDGKSCLRSKTPSLSVRNCETAALVSGEKKINFMQIYSGTRLSSAIHRRESRFFPEGGGDVCTQAIDDRLWFHSVIQTGDLFSLPSFLQILQR